MLHVRNFHSCTLYREAKLLWDEKTTISKALKPIGVDVAAVGAGGFAGVKAGAIVGSVFGPIGAAIGGLLGGVGGAITGKMAANGFRYANFNQAHAEYSRIVDLARESLDTHIAYSRARILELKATYEADFSARKREILRAAEHSLQQVRKGIAEDIGALTAIFPSRLDELIVELKSEEHQILSALPSSRFGMLFPTDQDLFRSATKHWFRRARNLVIAEKRKYLALADRSPDTLLGSIRQFFNDYDCELAHLRADVSSFVEHCAEGRQRAELIRAEAVEKTEAARNELIRALGDQVSKLYTELTRLIAGWNRRIIECREVLEREAKPVGIDL